MPVISKKRLRHLFFTKRMKWFAFCLAALSAASIGAVIAATLYRGQVAERAEAWAPVQSAKERVLELEASISVSREFNQKEERNLRQPDTYFAGVASHYFGTVRSDAERRRREIRQEIKRRSGEMAANRRALADARTRVAELTNVARRAGTQPADEEFDRADSIVQNLTGTVLLGHIGAAVLLLFAGFLYYRHG